jgi:AAA ATPase domain
MITQAEALAPADPCPTDLEPFVHHLLAANPFTANRVNGPSAADVDVHAIHERPFERLTALAREALDQGRGLGAVVWGEAGIGKSHLLSRLARWAGQDKHACFVYLHNLHASPENLPRSLLKALVSILTEGRQRYFHDTLLFRLANAGVRAALEQENEDRPTLARAERAFGLLVDCLCQADPARAALVDRTVYQVLFRFFRSDYQAYEGQDDGVAALAVRWLAGDFLDPAEARRLGLPPGPRRDEAVALADNQQVKQVLVALTQLALYRRQPFLLCLDQVDNLDDEQVAALARFLEALLDSAANLLVVTSGVQATLVGYRPRGVIQSSAWDRLAQFEIGLQRISVSESRQIVAERIRRFLEPLGDLEPVRQRLQANPLFPLGEPWAEDFFRDKIELRPRDVLNGARAAWQHEQEALQARGGPAWFAEWGTPAFPPQDGTAPMALTPEQNREAIDRKVDQKMEEYQAQILAEPHAWPADANHLSGLLQALLEQCFRTADGSAGARVERLAVSKNRQRPALDLIIHRWEAGTGREERAGLLCLVNPSATSTAAFLRRLVEDDRPVDRLLLVTDERQPLQLGSKGEDYLAELRGRRRFRFQHITLTLGQVAQLEALRAVVGLARSGDLEIEEAPGKTRPVSEEEVLASHRRRGRYRAAAVLGELLPGEGEPKR